MPLLLPLLPLLAQVGPFSSLGAHSPAVERPATAPRPVKAAEAAAPLPGLSAKAQDCLAAVEQDPEEAADSAAGWLATAKLPAHEKAEANLCLGSAQARSENWVEAEQAFASGRESAGADRMLRARLGAMAGSAALAGGSPARALTLLDAARSDSQGLAEPALTSDIALDRARALVALKRNGEAAAALADARAAQPRNAEAWLLSATLSRRDGKLAEAQTQIQTAAELLPIDPEIGLEAGVIAILAGHDDAARKSWQSVIAAAPESPAATTAKGYLAQLGASSAPPAPVRPRAASGAGR